MHETVASFLKWEGIKVCNDSETVAETRRQGAEFTIQSQMTQWTHNGGLRLYRSVETVMTIS